MILVLGGTTEGRIVIQVLDEAGSPYYYSTKSNLQQVEMVHGIRLAGAMRPADMISFCKEKEIHLIIDAAHPFALLLHKTVEEVSSVLGIPVIRYERKFPSRNPDYIWCKDYTDAIRLLEKQNIRKLLALSGVNTIAPLRPYWQKNNCLFRILDREESKAIVHEQGFPAGKVIYYKEENKEIEKEKELFHSLQPDAILTKESGFTGNFNTKVEAAQQLNIPLFVIQRPDLSDSFYKVQGEAGLRRQIDRLLPGFFPLRTGFTTGTCATAAAKAALLALLTNKKQTQTEIDLPSGESITLPVSSTEITTSYARCMVQKDAGDDPDVTNKSAITATVSIHNPSGKKAGMDKYPSVWIPLNSGRQLILSAGEGVGTVTLPGLGLETGGPAINTTPRKMIRKEIQNILDTQTGIPPGNIQIIISVPNGEEIAKRTFNPRLGIVGGISIIGTSGIVRPFSHEAFTASIRKEMEVAKAIGCTHIVINSGAKSERYLKTFYPDLLPQAFIHYGNYIGDTLRIASELQIPQLTLGIMIGKAVKLAEGYLDTHSKKVVMNKTFLQQIATEAGCSNQSVEKINHITLARELWELFPEKEKNNFLTLLLQKCYEHTRPLLNDTNLRILLLDENGTPYKHF